MTVSKMIAGVLLALMAGAALGQGFPAKPIKMLIPWPPGGGTDIIGRPIAERLSEALGQQVVIENRGGSNGMIGAEMVAKSPADGYTIMLNNMFSHVTNPSLYAKVPFDTERDFVPVSLVGSVTLVLVAHPSFNAKTVQDVIARAREKPGQFNYASFGSGSGSHLSGELLKRMAGIDIVHIPYKGGGPAIADTVAGHVPLHFSGLATAMPHVRAGRLNAIAVTSLRRSKLLADVPTMDESGLKGFDTNVAFGVLAPAATPRDIVKKLESELNKVLAQPELRQRLESQGFEGPFGTVSEDMAAFVKLEIPKWAKVIRESGVKVD